MSTQTGQPQDADGQTVRDPLRRIDGPKPAQRANDWLRATEEQQLLAAAITPEERIVITLLRWSGLRCGEAVQLLVRDIDFNRHELHIRHSKTRTGLRTVPLLPELEHELRVWLKRVQTRQPVRSDSPLLVTRNGTPMKSQFIVRVVKRVAQRAYLREAACFGGSTITPHTLRRTFATDLLNRGVRLESVAQLLGHASSQTTQRYYAELLPSVVRTEFYDAYETPAPLRRPPEQHPGEPPQHLRLIAGGRRA